MRNIWKRLAILLLVIFIFVSVPMRSFADFGDYDGDSDYGYDSGSDYSYDYGYDDDDDDDYYYSSSGGGSGGSSGSDIASDGYTFASIIIVFLMFYGVSAPFRKGLRQAKAQQKVRSSVPVGATPTTGLRPLADIQTWDPDFSASVMEDRICNLYVQMQNCWTDRDITPLRRSFTDEQFAQYDRQLQRYRDAHETNVIERIAILDARIVGMKQDNVHDILVARLSTRITSYTISDKTGQVVKGDRSKEKFMTYEWTLVRPKGSKTMPQDSSEALSCPNCGAPLDINKSAQCPYCNAVVSKAEHDWVISGIKGLSQRTT